jgi:ADP-heptose:LPS heptosyltransferase
MIDLGRITLIAIDCYNYGGAVAALKKSVEQCKFGAVKFLTDIPLKQEGIEVIQIPTISSKEQYSKFCVKELYKYIDTDFVLICQHDGYVLDSSVWNDEFYNYDYIGSPWIYEHGRNVGNGGFSLRSKKLQTILGTDELIDICHPEDQSICILYGDYLQGKHGIKFAPEELADTFSYELKTPVCKTFGFHGKFHKKFMPTVIIKRTAALGDVVMVEPVMRYFSDKGYRVVLDTLPQFQLLYLNHYFKVHKPQEIDQRLLLTAKFINLDMSYESQPTQLHLKSYFEYAGVSEEEYLPYLKTPQLSLGFPIAKETKLFKKYAILHVDNRPQGGRNIYDVKWEYVVNFLNGLGYTVIQLGRDETAIIPNAIRMNCTNENFLCYVTGGADLFVGIDSGISNIAAAFDVPCVIMFGSVDPNVIHPESVNKVFVNNHGGKGVCDKPYCWGSVIGTEGVKCYIDENRPPCASFVTTQVITAINEIHEQQSNIKI